MLPRGDARPLGGGGGGGSRGRGGGSPLWSASGGVWGSGNGGGRTGAAAAARRNALLFNVALAAASIALVVTAASLRELRALVQAQKQQQQVLLGGDFSGLLPSSSSGGHGGHAGGGSAPATTMVMAPPPPQNVPGALLLSSSSSGDKPAAAPTTIAPAKTTTKTAAAALAPGAADPSITTTKTLCDASAMPATEMWGDVVRWGSTHRLESAADCCAACRAHKPDNEDALDCNVWVWCGERALCGSQHRECWLKHLAHPSVARPMREGPGVGWTSGIVDRGGEVAAAGAGGGSEGGGGGGAAATAAPPVGVAAELERAAAAGEEDADASRRYHTVTTAQGPAVHWQTRVHYYHFLKQKAACEEEAARRRRDNKAGGKGGAKGAAGGCDMGGWTRLLHSGKADDLMDELPTFLADPLPESVVPHAWYPVLNRPYALLQWIENADIPERYILMSEPDHLLLRPLPNLAPSLSVPAAFPFFYIEPHREEYLPLSARFARPPPGPNNATRTLTRKEAMLIAPIGNSPTFLSTALARAVIPEWQRLSVAIFRDAQANKAWGWVQEMYAFTIALYNLGVRRTVLAPELAAQPPWDSTENARQGSGPPFYMIHYTYGCDYSLNGTHMRGQFGEWRFDKRTYAAKPPPRHLGDPPPGVTNFHVRTLVRSINEATEAIPCWEAYRALGGKLAECGDERATGVWEGVEERRRRVKMERGQSAEKRGATTSRRKGDGE